MTNEIVLSYVPCASEEEAASLAGGLLEKRLIACANIHETRSLYWWDGKLTDEMEHILLCKTTRARVRAAEDLIRELHSYDLPCILRLQPAQVNPEYAAWVSGEVTVGVLMSTPNRR